MHQPGTAPGRVSFEARFVPRVSRERFSRRDPLFGCMHSSEGDASHHDSQVRFVEFALSRSRVRSRDSGSWVGLGFVRAIFESRTRGVFLRTVSILDPAAHNPLQRYKSNRTFRGIRQLDFENSRPSALRVGSGDWIIQMFGFAGVAYL